MLLRILFLTFIALSLHAEEKSWYQKLNPSLEIGMHLSNFEGSIDNAFSSANFRDDFKYTDTYSTYLAIGFKPQYKYAPNIMISYFNEVQNENATLTKQIRVADGVFDTNSTVSTKITYQVLNVTLYKEFRQRGKYVRMFNSNIYTGDFELDVGLNLKTIKWDFNIFDAKADNASQHWINVDSVIPLPYIGFKYYLYRLRLFANISALSLSEAKATNFEFGVDFRVIDRLFLSATYLYEDFKAVEIVDTVEFRTVGNKFGFKYYF